MRRSRERAQTRVYELSKGLESYKAGQTGLLRLSWDNGDRTVLVNPELGGVTLGWNMVHTAQDELFAAIEGTAFHTRIILERMAEHGVRVDRVINAGGIPQKNEVLNQVYANVLEQAGAGAGGNSDEPRLGNHGAAGCRGFQDALRRRRRAVCLPLANSGTGCEGRRNLRATLSALSRHLLRAGQTGCTAGGTGQGAA